MPRASGILVRQIRAKKRRSPRAIGLLGERGTGPVGSVDTNDMVAEEARHAINSSMRNTSGSYREVVRLSLFEGLSAGEVGIVYPYPRARRQSVATGV